MNPLNEVISWESCFQKAVVKRNMNLFQPHNEMNTIDKYVILDYQHLQISLMNTTDSKISYFKELDFLNKNTITIKVE